MDNKCNNCAKFLTCNRQDCKKITFVEAGILDRPIRIDKKEWWESIEELNVEFAKSMEYIVDTITEAGIALKEFYNGEAEINNKPSDEACKESIKRQPDDFTD